MPQEEASQPFAAKALHGYRDKRQLRAKATVAIECRNILKKRGRSNDSERSVFSDDIEAGGNGILVSRSWLSLV